MNLLSTLRQRLHDPSLRIIQQVQSLWSDYGQIVRVRSEQRAQRYIVKVIAPDQAGQHPRGWNTSVSHRRKLRSYQVEAAFYQHYANQTDQHCQVPQLVACHSDERVMLLVMEDLDALGFTLRKEQADWASLKLAISWLAWFHGRFMGSRAENVWPVGTYWHLATRQDEWQAMPESELKNRALQIDTALNNAQFQTLVHGDAKFANLCFHPIAPRLAAVDFQYVGRGTGVKDLAYLVGSCLDIDGLNQYHHLILDEYLTQLKQALKHYRQAVNFDEVASEVRQLYPVAWADFYRFLIGWNPQSWKINDYMQQMTTQALTFIEAR